MQKDLIPSTVPSLLPIGSSLCFPATCGDLGGPYRTWNQITQLEEIQLAERKKTGKRPDKSDLVQEALDLLIQKYSKTD